jgi:hypothetical protein
MITTIAKSAPAIFELLKSFGLSDSPDSLLCLAGTFF